MLARTHHHGVILWCSMMKWSFSLANHRWIHSPSKCWNLAFKVPCPVSDLAPASITAVNLFVPVVHGIIPLVLLTRDSRAGARARGYTSFSFQSSPSNPRSRTWVLFCQKQLYWSMLYTVKSTLWKFACQWFTNVCHHCLVPEHFHISNCIPVTSHFPGPHCPSVLYPLCLHALESDNPLSLWMCLMWVGPACWWNHARCGLHNWFLLLTASEGFMHTVASVSTSFYTSWMMSCYRNRLCLAYLF